MKMEQSVPKRRHIKFRRRGITQKKDTTTRTRRKFEIKNFSSANVFRFFELLTTNVSYTLHAYKHSTLTVDVLTGLKPEKPLRLVVGVATLTLNLLLEIGARNSRAI
jgi:hypothetical protein